MRSSHSFGGLRWDIAGPTFASFYSFGESKVLEVGILQAPHSLARCLRGDLEIEATSIRIPGHERAVALQIDNPYTGPDRRPHVRSSL